MKKIPVPITDFFIMDSDGNEIEADAFGYDLAFDCPNCMHPILASAAENQRGSDEDCPSKCRGCEGLFFLDVRFHAQKLYIHEVGAGQES